MINCDTTRTIKADLLDTFHDFCQTLTGNAVQHSDLPCLVAGDTESPEKTHFPNSYVIRNQRFGFVRSTFRAGDNSNVRWCPDPSSPQCKGSGSETTVTLRTTTTITRVHTGTGNKGEPDRYKWITYPIRFQMHY